MLSGHSTRQHFIRGKRWSRYQGWGALLAGTWLILLTVGGGYANIPLEGEEIAYIVGAALILMSSLELLGFRLADEFRLLEQVADFTLGLFLIISPFALGYTTLAMPTLNAVAVGGALLLLCLLLDHIED